MSELVAMTKCTQCAGELVPNRQGGYVCKYCGTVYHGVVEGYNEEIEEIIKLRQMREFIKAEEACELLLKTQPENSEAHWQMLLTRYGVVYVEEEGKYKPTFFSYPGSDHSSILKDEHYLSACKFAVNDSDLGRYKEKGDELDKLLKAFFELMKKEKPYDIFISFKKSERVKVGDRERVVDTNEYKKACEIYDHLKDKYNVFFSPVSIGKDTGIEGEKYEPRILKALNTSMVMILVGFSEDNITAQWVQNEWRRYLYQIDKGAKKANSLIFVYEKNMWLPAALYSRQMPNVDCYNSKYLEQLEKKIQPLVKSSKGLASLIATKKVNTNFEENEEFGYASSPRVTIGGTASKVSVKISPTEERDLDEGENRLTHGKWKLAEVEFNNIIARNDKCDKAWWGLFKTKIKAKTDAEVPTQILKAPQKVFTEIATPLLREKASTELGLKILDIFMQSFDLMPAWNTCATLYNFIVDFLDADRIKKMLQVLGKMCAHYIELGDTKTSEIIYNQATRIFIEEVKEDTLSFISFYATELWQHHHFKLSTKYFELLAGQKRSSDIYLKLLSSRFKATDITTAIAKITVPEEDVDSSKKKISELTEAELLERLVVCDKNEREEAETKGYSVYRVVMPSFKINYVGLQDAVDELEFDDDTNVAFSDAVKNAFILWLANEKEEDIITGFNTLLEIANGNSASIIKVMREAIPGLSLVDAKKIYEIGPLAIMELIKAEGVENILDRFIAQAQKEKAPATKKKTAVDPLKNALTQAIMNNPEKSVTKKYAETYIKDNNLLGIFDSEYGAEDAMEMLNDNFGLEIEYEIVEVKGGEEGVTKKQIMDAIMVNRGITREDAKSQIEGLDIKKNFTNQKEAQDFVNKLHSLSCSANIIETRAPAIKVNPIKSPVYVKLVDMVLFQVRNNPKGVRPIMTILMSAYKHLEENELLRDITFRVAETFTECGKFKEGELWYDELIKMDQTDSDAFWGKVKCQTKCANDFEISQKYGYGKSERKQSKLTQLQAYINAKNSATDKQYQRYRALLDDPFTGNTEVDKKAKANYEKKKAMGEANGGKYITKGLFNMLGDIVATGIVLLIIMVEAKLFTNPEKIFSVMHYGWLSAIIGVVGVVYGILSYIFTNQGRKALKNKNRLVGIRAHNTARAQGVLFGFASAIIIIVGFIGLYASSGHTYEIDEAKDFNLLINVPGAESAHFVITEDIDFEGEEMKAYGKINVFQGFIDGQGHVVKNFNASREIDPSKFSSDNVKDNTYGFVKFLGKKGVLKDITFENATIKLINNTDNYKSFFGGFAGINGGHISNCDLKNSFLLVEEGSGYSASYSDYVTYVGGIAGYYAGHLDSSNKLDIYNELKVGSDDTPVYGYGNIKYCSYDNSTLPAGSFTYAGILIEDGVRYVVNPITNGQEPETEFIGNDSNVSSTTISDVNDVNLFGGEN